jgi:hypothetical protein
MGKFFMVKEKEEEIDSLLRDFRMMIAVVSNGVEMRRRKLESLD